MKTIALALFLSLAQAYAGEHPGLAASRLEPNFLDCPFDLSASALFSPSIVAVKGSQIAKTKLSVRKAAERHSKEGQEGRKEAPQAPTLRSISAYCGNEISSSY
jgi:hypothetical protein